MHTPTLARRFLQQTLTAALQAEHDEEAPLEAWLDAHTRHRTCVAIAHERGLIDAAEAQTWLQRAHGEEPAAAVWAVA
jgi:hypothetical protein